MSLDLEPFLGAQRWFAGKGRTFHVSDVTTIGEVAPRVRIDAVTVTYDDGSTETYQVPLSVHDQPQEQLAHVLVGTEKGPDGSDVMVYDALHDKDAAAAWFNGIASDRQDSELVFHRDKTLAEMPPGGSSLVIGAEQSNTSVIFGDTVILKVFRKISPGLNPDIEVHAALAAQGNESIATPVGWVEGTWRDDTGTARTASLAMAQTFLKDATDGWELALTSVRDLYAEADLHADEVGGDFAGEAHRLGASTAQVHAALAAALPTGTLTGPALAQAVDDMRSRLYRAAAEIDDLAPYVGGLESAFDAMAALTEPVPVQRVHGDFHLGQVMRTLQGWKLLDFEGEPARPLAERRALESPVKDVAGMLRSFDYAARHLLADHPQDAQYEYRANEWASRNRDAFCVGYARAGGVDPRSQTALLRAFETDKAVYEVMYEARNRPTWLHIPMAAIRRLAAAEE